MTVLILASDPTDKWLAQLIIQLKKRGLELRVWPECGNPEEIEIVLTLFPPPGVMQTFPHLELIISLGASVDRILADPHLPDRIPIVRLTPDGKIGEMVEYVIFAVLLCQRQLIEYYALQRSQHWEFRPAPKASSFTVGILGLGVFGSAVAEKLTLLGFPVRGWSRTPKTIAEVACFYGDEQFETFLSQSQAIVCLLPLTSQTEGILCQKTFFALPRGAYIINVARGKHLIEADLLSALASGQIAGACLDVFDREPLPDNHPFWSHSQIMVTPHIAALGQPEEFADCVIEAIADHCSGKPLQSKIDRDRGY